MCRYININVCAFDDWLFYLCHVLLKARLEDRHGGEGAGAHGHIGVLVRGTVGVDLEFIEK